MRIFNILWSQHGKKYCMIDLFRCLSQLYIIMRLVGSCVLVCAKNGTALTHNLPTLVKDTQSDSKFILK